MCILASEAFVAGIKWRWVGALFLAAAIGILAAYFTAPHVTARINKFLFDTGGDTYQIDMGLRAIREAGLFGGHTNNLKSSIPDVHTDFIFSAMVEEFGSLLTVIVVTVFFMMGIRIFSELKSRRDPFAVYAAAGIASYLLFQVCVNLSSTLGLIPTKGMTLPFISYGGSSFTSSCLGVGLALALLRSNEKPAT
jgi:cell division protein FtsW